MNRPLKQNLFFRKLFGAIICAFLTASSLAQEAPVIWYERVSTYDSVSLQQVLQEPQKLKIVTDKIINHGLTTETVWLVSSPLQFNSLRYLWIKNPTLGEIDFYLIDESSEILSRKTGYLRPFNSRDFFSTGFVFQLPIPSDSFNVRIVMKIKSSEALIVPLDILPAASIQRKLFNDQTIVLVVLGIVSALFLLYTVIFLYLRENDYFFYLIYALCSILVIGKINGLGFAWIWPDFPQLNRFSALPDTLVTFTGGIFSLQYLRIRKFYPVLSYFFIGCIVLQAVAFIIVLLGYNSFSLAITNGVSLFFMVFSILGGLLVFFRKKYKPAKYYLIGWPILYVGAIIYICRNLGIIISDNQYVSHALEIAIAIEMLILAVGVSRSIEQLRKQKEKMQLENIAIVENQNVLLEGKVAQRTKELEAQNEELIQQQKELTTQREIIVQQNKVIQLHNDELEKHILEQTEELRKSNHELADYNSQLEQFSYVTAHNLRSPVARILGLANLLELKKTTFQDDETKSILDKIITSSRNLDSIILDLNRILDLRRDQHLEFNEISLPALVERVKEVLSEEIQATKCNIECNFSAVDSIYSFQPYLESILFNLISNAIKYRDPKRSLRIQLESQLFRERILLRVSDNGLGIDLNKYGDKIFNLYKRFHSHVDGKGMGLFLAKTQVTMLKGDIQLSGVEGSGLTVSVILPRSYPEPEELNLLSAN